MLSPALCKNMNIKSVEDIASIEHSIPKRKTRLQRRTIRTTDAFYYVPPKKKQERTRTIIFRHGQLRNNDSNFNSPIEVLSPDASVNEEDFSTPGPLHSRVPHTSGSLVRLPTELYKKVVTPQVLKDNSEKPLIKPTHFRKRKSFMRGVKNTQSEGFTQNFMELVMKTHCRKHRLSLEDVLAEEFPIVSQEKFNKVLGLEPKEAKASEDFFGIFRSRPQEDDGSNPSSFTPKVQTAFMEWTPMKEFLENERNNKFYRDLERRKQLLVKKHPKYVMKS